MRDFCSTRFPGNVWIHDSFDEKKEKKMLEKN